MSMPSSDIYDYSFSELEERLRQDRVNPQHAKALWGFLYRDRPAADLPPPLRRWIDSQLGEGKRFEVAQLEVVDEIHSADGKTRKFLLRLDDGQVIETVLMGYDNRHTVCVSSQAGCAMGCVFCATGQMGFARDLRPGEIVAQVMHARRVLRRMHPDGTLRNMVMMGMGEPLNNYDAVLKALAIISDERGISMAASKITVSTVGVVPGIARLATEEKPYGLAVSLHGSTEDERRALVPASKRWPLEMLIQSCRDYGTKTGRKIFFEWTLIEGKNDAPETAARLGELLTGMDAHVNIIPLNPTGGFDGEPSQSGRRFQEILREAGLPCTFRQRRGIDVAAGCGMLKAERQRA